MNRNNDDKNEQRKSQSRWRNRMGVRVATVALSIGALGGGAVLATQPVNAASTTKSAPAPGGGAMPNFAGWGG